MTLAERLLALLDRTGRPMATPELVARTDTGRPHHRQQVWGVLRGLLAAGLVRQARRVTGRRVRSAHTLVYWAANGG